MDRRNGNYSHDDEMVRVTVTHCNTISRLLLYMIDNEDVQSKARDEILHVVGEDRLPTMGDRVNMPYMQVID